MSMGGGSSSTVTKQELAPEQRELLNLAMPNLTEYMKTPLQMFPYSTVAPFNDTQLAARDMLTQTSGDINSLFNSGSDAVSTLFGLGTTGATGVAANSIDAQRMGVGGLGDVLASYSASNPGRDFLSSGALLDPSTNPILGAQTEAALRPITEDLMNKVLPGIRTTAMGNNMFGSSRQGIAEGNAIGDWMNTAADTSANIQANNFNKGLDAMVSTITGAGSNATSALGAALGAGSSALSPLMSGAQGALGELPNLANMGLLSGMTLDAVGESERSYIQSLLTEASDRFNTEQMLPFLQAEQVANLAFGMGGGSSSAVSNQSPAFDPVSTGLGLMMMLPLLGVSDRRIKRNVKQIGRTQKGINVYQFEYTFEPGIRTGVMAQEMEQIMPEVVEEFSGVKVVNYGLLVSVHPEVGYLMNAA